MSRGAVRQLSRAHKDRILERDYGVCVYCQDAVATEVDHVKPWSWDHDDDNGNLVAACHDCNLLASDMIFESFKAKRDYILVQREKPRHQSSRHRARLVETCPYCSKSYKPGITGTNVCCTKCAEE